MLTSVEIYQCKHHKFFNCSILICFVYYFLSLIYLDIAKPRLQKNPPDPLCQRWHHQPISIDKVMCLPFIVNCYMHLLTRALHFSIQYYLKPFQMLIIIAMPEMFQQCLQEREVERVLNETCDAIVSKCLWWLTINGKAHNFVYWNWLMMSSRAKMIRMIFL